MFFQSHVWLSVPVWKGVSFSPRFEVGLLNNGWFDGEFRGWRNQYGFGLHTGLVLFGLSVQLELDIEKDFHK